MSWASAEPPNSTAAISPTLSFAVTHLIKSSLGVKFLGVKCAEHGAGLSMPPGCRSVAGIGAFKADMMTTVFAAGGYRTIPAVFQYSGGVAAEPGFEIVRARFHRPVPPAPA